VNTLGVVTDKVVGRLFGEQFFVMDQIKVVIDELLLESSIVALLKKLLRRRSGFLRFPSRTVAMPIASTSCFLFSIRGSFLPCET